MPSAILPTSQPKHENARKKRLQRLVVMLGKRAAETRVENSVRMQAAFQRHAANGSVSICNKKTISTRLSSKPSKPVDAVGPGGVRQE